MEIRSCSCSGSQEPIHAQSRLGQDLVPAGMCLCIPSKTLAVVLLSSWCNLTPLVPKGHLQACTAPSQFMAHSSLSSVAAAQSTAALAVPSHCFHSELGEAHGDLSQPCHPLHVGSTIDCKDRFFEINCRGNRMSASQQGLQHMQPSLGHTAAMGREKGTRGRVLERKNFRHIWRILEVAGGKEQG